MHALSKRLLTRPDDSILARLGRELRGIAELGPLGWVVYCVNRLRIGSVGFKREFVVRSKHAAHPLRCRPDTSDFDVFRQIFYEREYSCLDDLEDVGLIVDCGANVGYSSAYLLSNFPNSKVIAIEPDAGNFDLLVRNTAAYGDRITALKSAVWSRPTTLAITAEKWRDGREWTRQVREVREGEGDIEAIDIGTILRESGYDRISLLKVDIEGAEAVVFSDNVESWLPYVDNIVIELHEDTDFGDAISVFGNAIAGRGFSLSSSGELTVCTSAAPRTHSTDAS